jgi:hypothetical protein
MIDVALMFLAEVDEPVFGTRVGELAVAGNNRKDHPVFAVV